MKKFSMICCLAILVILTACSNPGDKEVDTIHQLYEAATNSDAKTFVQIAGHAEGFPNTQEEIQESMDFLNDTVQENGGIEKLQLKYLPLNTLKASVKSEIIDEYGENTRLVADKQNDDYYVIWVLSKAENQYHVLYQEDFSKDTIKAMLKNGQ
ncbi:hypothetical protein [Terrilactibacillus laevilacticus]|uniref:Lipoprotein n=1 Tax=Terrilactibacillus laevilacticus TaxID=1380157 RepID=A0ABW5PK28_9BACI|nr:hypothetical protein [Terrilactibacillus laevilacticus]